MHSMRNYISIRVILRNCGQPRNILAQMKSINFRFNEDLTTEENLDLYNNSYYKKVGEKIFSTN